MDNPERFKKAMEQFDVYNANDPHQEEFSGTLYPKELLYGRRMSERLVRYAPEAPEYVRLAARCQHIGRWEIPRNSYPMDRKGYLQWRNTLKVHHTKIAGEILTNCQYDEAVVDKVNFLLLKKELSRNADTQLLEDVICLVFIQYYLDEFASKHEPEKVVTIVAKTMKKMSPKAISEVAKIPISEKIKALIRDATSALQ